MAIAVGPKLLRHINDGRLYAFLGCNTIAYRFGRQIEVARVTRKIGPLCILGRPFSESIDFYIPAPSATS